LIGLKIWTTNTESFPRLRELYDKKDIDYVELYIVPGSFSKQLGLLKGIPLILHAPNFNHGFSVTADNEEFASGIDTAKQVSEFFGEKRIIFHPGYIQNENDSIGRLIKVLAKLPFDIILENVPRKGYKGKVMLLIHKPEEYMRVINETGCKFCLDLGHAIAAANTEHLVGIEYIREFMALRPYMFHISDGNYNEETDSHLGLGQGSYPLQDMINLLPEGAIISLETPKSDFQTLRQDVYNLSILRDLLTMAR
jgi:endonuclease IV